MGINVKSSFPTLELLGGVFHFYSNFNRIYSVIKCFIVFSAILIGPLVKFNGFLHLRMNI